MANNQANIKAVITAEDRASDVLRGFSNTADSVSASITKNVRRASYAFVAAAGFAAKFAISSSADFEQSRIAFETMLGSADAAKKMLKDVSDFAAKTPFELPEVVTGAKQLLAYNIEAEKILPTFKALGNIAAGVGKDKLPQLILAFGQVRAATRLTGMELRQFTEAGVPLLSTLAKQLGKTEGEIQEMVSAGEIGFPAVEKAIFGMSQEGGKFFNLMDRQSHTFSGVVSNIKDDIGRLARSVVGISETGEIRENSIFAKLRDSAISLLTWLDKNKDNITRRAQEISDAVIKRAGEMLSGLQNKIRSEGFAEGLTSAFVESIGRINWSKLTAAAVAGFAAVAPDIAIGIGKGLFQAITQNPLDMAILFALLGFVPGLTTIFAAVLGGIPLIGTLLAWIVTGIGGAAAAAVPTITASGVAIGGAVVSGVAIGLAGLGAVVIGAAALILHSLDQTMDAINHTKNAVADLENSNRQAMARINKSYEQGKISLDQLYRMQQGLGLDFGVAKSGNTYTGTFATGGYTGQGGVNDIAGLVHRGEYVIPQSGVNQSTGMPKSVGSTINVNVNVGMYAGTEIEKRKVAQSLLQALKDAAATKNMNLGELFT